MYTILMPEKQHKKLSTLGDKVQRWETLCTIFNFKSYDLVLPQKINII